MSTKYTWRKYTWRANLDGVVHTSKRSYFTELGATKAADSFLTNLRHEVVRPDAQLKAEVLKGNEVVATWEGCYWVYLIEIGTHQSLRESTK